MKFVVPKVAIYLETQSRENASPLLSRKLMCTGKYRFARTVTYIAEKLFLKSDISKINSTPFHNQIVFETEVNG